MNRSSFLRPLLVILVLGGAGYFVARTFLKQPAPASPETEAQLDADTGPPDSPTPAPPPTNQRKESTPAPATHQTARQTAETGDVEAVTGQSGFATNVVDKQGAPVGGAVVRLFKGSSNTMLNFPGARRATGIETVTDEDGTFVFENLAAWHNYVVVVSKEGFADTEKAGIAVGENDYQALPHPIVMSEGSCIHGTVKSAAGAALAGATVELWNTMDFSTGSAEDKQPWKVATVDATGEYEFCNISFNTCKLVAFADNHARVTKNHASLFAKAEGPTRIDFELPPALEIAGLVLDPRGMPVGDALLQAYQIGTQQTAGASEGNTRSASDGTFRIRSVADGQYNLSVRAKGFSDKMQNNVAGGASDVRILLEPRGALSGKVTVRSTGQAVTRFVVRLKTARGEVEPYPTGRVQAVRSNDGSFVLDDLDPGSYVVEAEAEGYAPTDSATVFVDRGQTATGADVALTQGATLRGTVTNAQGEPVPGATITIRADKFVNNPILDIFRHMQDANLPVERSTRTKGDGTFQLTHLVPGTRQVEVKKEGYSLKAVNGVQLQDEQTLDMGRVNLSSGGTIRGRALDAQGRPFSEGNVSCAGPEGLSLQRRPDVNGYFEFESLAAGEYTLTLNPERVNGQEVNPFIAVIYANKASQKVNVVEGQVSEARLQLPADQRG